MSGAPTRGHEGAAPPTPCPLPHATKNRSVHLYLSSFIAHICWSKCRSTSCFSQAHQQVQDIFAHDLVQSLEEERNQEVSASKYVSCLTFTYLMFPYAFYLRTELTFWEFLDRERERERDCVWGHGIWGCRGCGLERESSSTYL